MRPNIGITDEHCLEIAKVLNTLLADEFVLYAKTRNYHWNVSGPQFMELHKFFEAQYEELDEIMDSVAERVRQLGHYALGSLQSFGKQSRLTEGQDESTASKMIATLLNDHETIIRQVRMEIEVVDSTYKDAGTADFLTGILKDHEKMAWMLRAHMA